jgi:hypothetical protein
LLSDKLQISQVRAMLEIPRDLGEPLYSRYPEEII